MLALATSGPESARNEIYFLPGSLAGIEEITARGSPDKILTSRLTDDAPFRTDEKTPSPSFSPTKRRVVDAVFPVFLHRRVSPPIFFGGVCFVPRAIRDRFIGWNFKIVLEIGK